MLNNIALNIVVALVFIYLLYSLLGTLIQEIIATNIGLRGITLKKAIKCMLDDDENSSQHKLSTSFYKHPLIKYLGDGSWPLSKKPAYIDRQTFSKVIIDLLRGPDLKPGDPLSPPIQSSLDTKKVTWPSMADIDKETWSYLNSIWIDAEGDVQKFKALLEQWFDEMMDRVSGWYKKYTQLILLFVGLAIAIVFNVDTLQIVSILQNNPTVRDQVITQANTFVKDHPNLDIEIAQTQAKIKTEILAGRKDSLQQVLKEDTVVKNLGNKLIRQASGLVNDDIGKMNSVLAIGWSKGFLNERIDLRAIIGWLITALAISLGAPFWFDFLNKLTQLRGSISTGSVKPQPNDTVKKTQ